jgi:hypothetical protein
VEKDANFCDPDDVQMFFMDSSNRMPLRKRIAHAEKHRETGGIVLIGITAAMIIAIGVGIFVVLFAATAMTRRSVELDRGLEEQPIEQWITSTPSLRANSSTQLRLS